VSVPRQRFRVGYLDRPMHEAFLTAAAADERLEIVRIDTAQPAESVLSMLASCHGYYAHSGAQEIAPAFRVTAEFLAAMPRLLLVATYGAGYDAVDVAACTAAGVAVVNQAGGNAEAVAEHAVGMMLALLKRMPETEKAVRAGAAPRSVAFLGRELVDRTIGLVGLGHTGTRTAEIVRAFRCRVLAYDPYLDAAACAARGATKVALPELLAESDVVSVHCPLTAETRGMLGAAEFAVMRKNAIFVTTARGGIHDEDALEAALRSGHLGGAGLDVWASEPPPAAHALLSLPSVLATRHTAGVTVESRTRVARMAAAAFSEAAAGDAPSRLVNPAALRRYTERRDAVLRRNAAIERI
jgi:D-3-phosphoglycerate dehydrogenase